MSVEKCLDHIEFFGYKATQDEDGDWVAIRDEHPRKLLVREAVGGIGFSIFFDLDGSAFDLESANQLNKKIWLSTAAIYDENSVGLDFWIPSYGDRETFGKVFNRFLKEADMFMRRLIDESTDED
ncbi:MULTISPECIES: hypothetical protein [Vibrio]|uniref:hypothetical protein n=1 Tax=Vibrio TaxID=662 RepID=UPI001CDC1CB8|nr:MULTISPECIES: hypothetical protein [Vibrio]MCA2441636.1 hypothetical protein [Vibrio alginolyticus]MDW1731998.1 hypothetical protein [Vibrio sp. Vb2356]MDW1934196.1 hypothetical protein [Vibrio sp. 970]